MIWGIFKKPKTELEEIEALRRKVYGEEALKEEEKYSKQLEKNRTAHELEKIGKVDEAIKLYEQNVNENFVGNHPYQRLAVIYRKRRQVDEEMRILEKAVSVIKRKSSSEEFRTRLGKIYNKLAISYHQDEQYDDEVRILEKALKVFKGDEFFKRRLEKAKALRASKE
jgi:tetratricopeptide (TPR) repeat protein